MVKADSNNSTSQFRNQERIFIGLLSVWIFLLFLTGKNNEFVVWDDPKYVYNNDLVMNPTFANLGLLLKSIIVWNYHPITMFSLWFNAFLFGKNPSSFIIINALIHTINAILVFKIAQKLTTNLWICFFTALFWGIHPMHVESVTWVSERKDVLYTFFFFLAILSYIKFLNQNNRKYLIISILWFIFSCLSKGMAVVLPLTLLLIDYWFDKKIFTFKNLIIDKLPFWIISIIIGLITINVQGGGDLNGLLNNQSLKTGAFIVEATWLERLNFAGYGFMTYIFKLFVPIHLRHWYPFPDDRSSLLMILSSIGFLLVLVFTIYNFRKNKSVFFGLSFFIVSIALVLQFTPVGKAVLAERYTYLAYFGLLFLIFSLLNKYLEKNIFKTSAILIAIIFSIISFKQIKTWKNTLALWENTFQYQPAHKETAMSLISEYKKRGNTAKITEVAQKAIDNGLKNASIYQSLANAQNQLGDFNGVIETTQLVEKYATPQDSIDYKLLYLNKVSAYENLGKRDSAMIYMSKVQQLLINQ